MEFRHSRTRTHRSWFHAIIIRFYKNDRFIRRERSTIIFIFQSSTAVLVLSFMKVSMSALNEFEVNKLFNTSRRVHLCQKLWNIAVQRFYDDAPMQQVEHYLLNDVIRPILQRRFPSQYTYIFVSVIPRHLERWIMGGAQCGFEIRHRRSDEEVRANRAIHFGITFEIIGRLSLIVTRY